MGKLPASVLPTDTMTINGTDVTYRSLSRSEAMKVTTAFKDNPDGAEIFILSCGVDITEEEAAAWRDTTDLDTAGKLIDAIIVITGLGPQDSK